VMRRSPDFRCAGWARSAAVELRWLRNLGVGERAALAGEEGEQSTARDLDSHAGAAYRDGCGAGAGGRNGWEAITWRAPVSSAALWCFEF
jgi:hypothetical protein